MKAVSSLGVRSPWYWAFFYLQYFNGHAHGLRTPREEIAFTARPKIHSHSQIFRYSGSIFCLPHRPKFSGFFDLCLQDVSVVPGCKQEPTSILVLGRSLSYQDFCTRFLYNVIFRFSIFQKNTVDVAFQLLPTVLKVNKVKRVSLDFTAFVLF